MKIEYTTYGGGGFVIAPETDVQRAKVAQLAETPFAFRYWPGTHSCLPDGTPIPNTATPLAKSDSVFIWESPYGANLAQFFFALSCDNPVYNDVAGHMVAEYERALKEYQMGELEQRAFHIAQAIATAFGGRSQVTPEDLGRAVAGQINNNGLEGNIEKVCQAVVNAFDGDDGVETCLIRTVDECKYALERIGRA